MELKQDYLLLGEKRRKLIVNLLTQNIVTERIGESLSAACVAFDKKGGHFQPTENINPLADAIDLTGVDFSGEQEKWEMMGNIYDYHTNWEHYKIHDRSADFIASKIYEAWCIAIG
ncbi:hypothetical protein [Croceitalea rosinachiae]|uniref:Uncharacterized protein n=1 Tax=Croceitalea rosinachiae TaxID=3075596 RepID=A0ABU3ACX1_9FLAO|nr:hypothetical protein [Croceitalea sp. F388]MDT0608032.1 hypothetical protein [Croceitalea sp. F388]